MNVPVDIIVYALVAVGLILWLRSLLGMRQDDERQRPNPFAGVQVRPESPQPRLLPATKTGVQDALVPAILARPLAIEDAAQDGVSEIMKADKYFDPAEFLKGAQDAFVMIVEAYAAGNRETLQPLLEDALYADFDAGIKQRETDARTATVEIHAVRRVELVRAWIDRKIAFVTVRFVADETNLVHDAAGAVVSGNPDRIAETADLWTFRRDTRSKGPEWKLAATREEGVDTAEARAQDVPDGGTVF